MKFILDAASPSLFITHPTQHPQHGCVHTKFALPASGQLKFTTPRGCFSCRLSPFILLSSNANSSSQTFQRAGTLDIHTRCMRCLGRRHTDLNESGWPTCKRKCVICDRPSHKGKPCPMMRNEYADCFTPEWLRAHIGADELPVGDAPVQQNRQPQSDQSRRTGRGTNSSAPNRGRQTQRDSNRSGRSGGGYGDDRRDRSSQRYRSRSRSPSRYGGRNRSPPREYRNRNSGPARYGRGYRSPPREYRDRNNGPSRHGGRNRFPSGEYRDRNNGSSRFGLRRDPSRSRLNEEDSHRTDPHDGYNPGALWRTHHQEIRHDRHPDASSEGAGQGRPDIEMTNAQQTDPQQSNALQIPPEFQALLDEKQGQIDELRSLADSLRLRVSSQREELRRLRLMTAGGPRVSRPSSTPTRTAAPRVQPRVDSHGSTQRRAPSP